MIPQQQRITVIDALRGFTLWGILVVHTRNLWGFPQPAPAPDSIGNSINMGITYLIENFMTGKFNSIFAMLFGVSFFIQLSRAEAKGTDFRARFVWRLILLIFIGYLHQFAYTWEALMEYGLVGIPLVLFYKLDKKRVLVLAISALLAHTLYPAAIQHVWPAKPQQTIQVQHTEPAAEEEERSVSAKEFFKYNAGHSAYNRVRAMKNDGPFATFGLFLLGLFLAKIKFFEDAAAKKKLLRKILYISAGAFCLLFCLNKGLFAGSSAAPVQYISRASTYCESLLFSAGLVSGFVLLYSGRIRPFLDYLVPYGKLGLTNYIGQSIFGLLVFAPFFLGLNTQGVLVREIIALLFYIFQVLFCIFWVKRFAYGPVEWFWRSATWLRRMPFRKIAK